MATSVGTGGDVTVLRRPLPGRWSPAEVLRALRDEDRPFALVGAWAGGGAVVGSEPVRVMAPGDDPFALLDELPVIAGDAPPSRAGDPPGAGSRTGPAGPGVGRGPGPGAGRPVACGTGGPAAPDALPPVGGGWFGYLGYQLNRVVERLPAAPGAPPGLPSAALAYHDNVARQGPDGRWWFEALPTPGRRRALDARYHRLARRMEGRPPPARPHAVGPFRMVPGPEAHGAAVEAALAHIRAGDVYQANICLRADARLEGDPLDLFCAGVGRLRPAFGAYVRLPEGAVCSFSPELFLRAAPGRGGDRPVVTSPIKGTAPRGPDPAVASAQRRALEASAKDRAENVMIVDLMRNDLGRVCQWGTVTVPRLFRAEPHPGLWHLVSDVAGRLRPGVGAAELLRAAFPPGSCTGAPKVRAMELINELESTARGAYTGAVGFVSPLAGLTLNVAIRTAEWVAATGAVTLGVGGGIVSDSDPRAELQECVTKAAPVIAALGGHLEPPWPAPP